MPPTVLIVDDEAHMLRVTELSLRRGQIDLLIGHNGRQALEIARRVHPDLIVMDVLMPEMDGLTALREMKQDPTTSDIPVIMLTARGHQVTRQDAENSGASLFLTKPFSPTRLLQEVRRLILPPNPQSSPISSTETGWSDAPPPAPPLPPTTSGPPPTTAGPVPAAPADAETLTNPALSFLPNP